MALILTDIRLVAIVSNVKDLKINHRPVSLCLIYALGIVGSLGI
jgi:hypothetical protein